MAALSRAGAQADSAAAQFVEPPRESGSRDVCRRAHVLARHEWRRSIDIGWSDGLSTRLGVGRFCGARLSSRHRRVRRRVLARLGKRLPASAVPPPTAIRADQAHGPELIRRSAHARRGSLLLVPHYSPEELAAIESDRRRRVTAALRLGSTASAGVAGPAWLAPLIVGLAAALAIALVAGVVTLAQGAARTGTNGAPAATATPSAR